MIPMRSGVKRVAASVVDGCLSGVARLTGWSRQSPGPFEAPRVLVVRCDHIGDSIMTTSILDPLRDALQPSTLDVLSASWAAPIFERHPAVDRVHRFNAPWWLAARHQPLKARLASWAALPSMVANLRAQRYDIGIDMRGDLRQIFLFLALGGVRDRASSDRTGGASLLTRVVSHRTDKHQVERDMELAALFGAEGPPRQSAPTLPELTPAVVARLQGTEAHGFATLALRGNKPNRSWPVEEASALAAEVFEATGILSVYVGGPDERAFGEELENRVPACVRNLAGHTSVIESCAVIAKARVMVAVDSGPMHMATMVGTPVVAMFGPGYPDQFGPWGRHSRLLMTPNPCPCPEERCVRTADGSAECMTELRAPTVTQAVLDVLKQAAATA